MMIISRL